MATARRSTRAFSSGSSGGASSSDDDAPSTVVGKTMSKAGELSLKDDEYSIDFQAPLPEDYGKKN